MYALICTAGVVTEVTMFLAFTDASPDRFASFLVKTIKINKPDVARNFLLSKRPWSNMEVYQFFLGVVQHQALLSFSASTSCI